jgi:uncharacterized membrane protein YjgN (DUF898 family)
MAATLVALAEYWLWVGALVALPFLTFGIDRIDEDARGAYVFRALILPGVLAIWPIVLWRWYVLETGRDDWRLRHLPERRAHGKLWIVVATAIVLVLVAGLTLRQTAPVDVAPILLETPE